MFVEAVVGLIGKLGIEKVAVVGGKKLIEAGIRHIPQIALSEFEKGVACGALAATMAPYGARGAKYVYKQTVNGIKCAEQVISEKTEEKKTEANAEEFVKKCEEFREDIHTA